VNWIDGRLALLDFESTGVNVETDRVVTAAFHMVGGGEKSTVSHWLINPGIDISPDATAVHGITNERARDEGVPAPGAIGEIAFAVRLAIHKGWPIIGHNIATFDLTMLDRECRRHGIEPPPWEHIRVIDTLVIDKWADQFRRGSRRLDATCKHYGIELGDDAHDAGADALAAGRLAYRMLRRSDLGQGRHPEIVARRAFWKSIRGDLDLLQSAQRTWQREQAEGLARYFTEKGEHEKAQTVRIGWPLVPFEAQVTA
jgi:DNA polymerase III epsilon subunit-like protein